MGGFLHWYYFHQVVKAVLEKIEGIVGMMTSDGVEIFGEAQTVLALVMEMMEGMGHIFSQCWWAQGRNEARSTPKSVLKSPLQPNAQTVFLVGV